MDDILADLLGSTSALGVWLFGSMIVRNHPSINVVLAGAVRDPSIKPPMKAHVESGTYFGSEENHNVFGERIGRATLVFLFDKGASLGLIRLRARSARAAIERAIASHA